MIYHFEQFELDMARFELREDGAVQPLEPQVFALLAYLIEHRERLVPKNELFEKLWHGRVVTDSALTSRIKSARQALGDSGKGQHFIKTIYGKGFRFIADVRFAGDMVHELITEIARLRSLLVSARGGANHDAGGARGARIGTSRFESMESTHSDSSG
jgi:DNA-binding winged helix-turn-helix (wHTH) protein